jgi:GxxExxY protein
MKNEIIYPKRGYEILGACFEVYKQVGNGFSEPLYQECLEFEFAIRKIPFVSQPTISIDYKGKKTKKHFVPDFVCFDSVILEIKAVETLTKSCDSQIFFYYLFATGMKLGILANFGHHPLLEHRRIANTRTKTKISLIENLITGR